MLDSYVNRTSTFSSYSTQMFYCSIISAGHHSFVIATTFGYFCSISIFLVAESMYSFYLLCHSIALFLHCLMRSPVALSY